MAIDEKGLRQLIKYELSHLIKPIEDWCNAHDNRMAEARNLLNRATKPTIEQEIEAGLYGGGGLWYVRSDDGIGDRCTRIYLPEGKYDEYVGTGPKEGVMFHGIPVYCGGPDIHYCTDP